MPEAKIGVEHNKLLVVFPSGKSIKNNARLGLSYTWASKLCKRNCPFIGLYDRKTIGLFPPPSCPTHAAWYSVPMQVVKHKAQSASTGAFRAFTGIAYGGYCGGYFGCQRDRTSIWII
jgi:hypothetical protein